MSPKLSRRQFLKAIAAGSVVGLGAKFALDAKQAPHTILRSRALMGTVINLSLISGDTAQADAAFTAMFNTMSGLEALLSHYRADSQVSQLNRDGSLDNAHPALLALIQQAQEISKISGGAYDITVKPLVDLYKQHAADGEIPTPQAIESALTLVDYRAITIEDTRVSFAQPGMALSLDSIAKGYIVDQGVGVLREHGFDNGLVEAGGDIVATGMNPDAQAWTIGVQSPRQNSAQTVFSISNQAIATSGDYQQPFTQDLSQHHILDPRTGYSSPELASATVIAPNAVQADALATAIMVLGVEASSVLLKSLPACNGYLISKNSGIYQI